MTRDEINLRCETCGARAGRGLAMWIPVTILPPEVAFITVFTRRKDGVMGTDFYDHYGNWHRENESHDRYTHWMFIPEIIEST